MKPTMYTFRFVMEVRKAMLDGSTINARDSYDDNLEKKLCQHFPSRTS